MTSFALAHQEHTMAVKPLLQHQLSCVHARQCTMKPRIFMQIVITAGGAATSSTACRFGRRRASEVISCLQII